MARRTKRKPNQEFKRRRNEMRRKKDSKRRTLKRGKG